MRVQRILHADRQEVVDEDVAGRRDPQADDIVNVKAVEGGAVYARDGVGQDEAAENKIEGRPDEGADQIPECNIEGGFEAPTYRDQELAGSRRGDNENGEF